MGNTSGRQSEGLAQGGLNDWHGDKVDGSHGSANHEQQSNLPVLEIRTASDIPQEYQTKLTAAGIQPDDYSAHLQATLSILHFLYRRKFKLIKGETQPSGTDAQAAAPAETAEEFEVTRQAEVLEGPDEAPASATQPEITDMMTPEDLAREARSITDGDPLTHFTKFVSHGQGGFGRVDRAKHIKSKQTMAIKRMPHATVKQRKANMQEIHFLRLLRGKPNIVNYYATFRKEEEVWVVMEFMEGGTLLQASARRALNEGHLAYLARETLKGIQIMHKAHLAHRDLKPQNVMIDIDGAVKLIDFGLCVDLKKNPHPKSMLGSAYWMAPEMILRQPYSTPVDIWAFGVIIWEILLGKPITELYTPLKAMWVNATQGGPSIKEARSANLSHAKSKTETDTDGDMFGNLVEISKAVWSDHAYDFVSRCLVVDPAKRATASELLKHPFLQAASDQREMRRILKVLFLSNSLSDTM